MSRRDLTHVMTAIADAARAQAGVDVPVEAIDEAIGRAPGDMRTPLNLQSLEEAGLVRATGAGTWSLTEAGVQRMREDRELSDR
jgi:repressor of nif and glnA expression